MTENETQITEANENIVSRTLMKECTIDLTSDEIVELAKLAASTERAITEAEVEFDGVKKIHKGKIEELEGEMRAILSKIRESNRTEVIECTEIKNYFENKVSYFMGEKLIEERIMTGDELQKDLFARQAQDTPRDAEFEAKGKELFQESAKPSDVQDVIRDETSYRTKHSSVDGPLNV